MTSFYMILIPIMILMEWHTEITGRNFFDNDVFNNIFLFKKEHQKIINDMVKLAK